MLSCRACGVTLGAALAIPGPEPVVLQWFPFRVLPGGGQVSQEWLCQVLCQYMLEQKERQAVHHFLLADMNHDEMRPQLLLWLFQPLLALQIPGEPLRSVSKILFREAPVAPPGPHSILLLPQDACNEIAQALQASAQVYPDSRRALGEWQVGWLSRSID